MPRKIRIQYPGATCHVMKRAQASTLHLPSDSQAALEAAGSNLSSRNGGAVSDNVKNPILWSTRQDASGKRLVFTVDLMNGIFSDELLTEEELGRKLHELEAAVGRQTGNTDFRLQVR